MTEIAVVTAVVDETSSMFRLKEPTINGFNAFFAKLKSDSADTPVWVSLYKFSRIPNGEYFRPVVENEALESVPVLTSDTYLPHGDTPLNDALAAAIDRTARIVASRNATRVTLMIQTDGEENASLEYPGWEGTQRLRQVIEEYQAKGWQFLFLGADLPSTYEAATQRGFARGSTVSYVGASSGETMTATAQNTASYSTGNVASNYFTQAQKRQSGDQSE